MLSAQSQENNKQKETLFNSNGPNELLAAAILAATSAANASGGVEGGGGGGNGTTLPFDMKNFNTGTNASSALLNSFLFVQQNPFLIHQIQSALNNLKQNNNSSSMEQSPSQSPSSFKNDYVSKMKTNRHSKQHQNHNNNNNNNNTISSQGHRRNKPDSNDIIFTSSSSSSSESVSSDSIPSSPSISPQPDFNMKQKLQNQIHNNNHLIHNHQLQQTLSVPKLMPHSSLSTSHYDLSSFSHSCYSLPNNSRIGLQKQNTGSNTSLNTLTQSSSNVSLEVKQKLKNCILQKLKTNTNTSSKSNLILNTNQTSLTTVSNSSTQKQEENMISKNYELTFNPTALLPQQQQHQQEQNEIINLNKLKNTHIQNLINEDNSLRRTTSEPNLKVKSALKDRLLEKRNLLNPFNIQKRPQKYQQTTSNNIVKSQQNILNYQQQITSNNNNNNTKHEQEQSKNQNAILAAVAAATAAAVAAVQSQNPAFQTGQFQAQDHMALIQTILQQQQQQQNDYNKLKSSISYPNIGSSINYLKNEIKTENNSSKNFQFGHIVHVEEENELLLENELKTVAKQTENSYFSNSNSYFETLSPAISTTVDRNQTLPPTSYKFKHRHEKYYNYINQKQNKFSSKQSSYFSDPYLLKSFQYASIGSQNNLLDNLKNLQDQQKQIQTIQNTPNECSLENETQKKLKYTTGIVYDELMLKHECTCMNSENHLETPDRIKSIWNRIKTLDLENEYEVIPSKIATINDLLTCHNEQYALIFGSDIEQRPRLPKEYLQHYMMNVCLAQCRGIALTYDQDNSWNEEHTPIACRVAIGSTYELANLVCNNKLKNGFAIVRPPGSHAENNKPLGFCYFNTVACVAKMLKKNLGLERILIVDWDVHHGNGTQQMTYNDQNIMYISLHRHDNGNFFPGTGSIDECGEDAGLGKNINIAWNGLNPPMSDAEYLAAFRCVVMPIAKEFKPQIVLVSAGFDATEQHPKELGGFKVSPTCFAYMTKKLMSLADGKIVLALEGGYDLKSLCDCSELCLNALMNKQIPSFSNQVLNALPNSSAIQDLQNVIEVQKKYWPIVNSYAKYIRMSHNQFISVYTE